MCVGRYSYIVFKVHGDVAVCDVLLCLERARISELLPPESPPM